MGMDGRSVTREVVEKGYSREQAMVLVYELMVLMWRLATREKRIPIDLPRQQRS